MQRYFKVMRPAPGDEDGPYVPQRPLYSQDPEARIGEWYYASPLWRATIGAPVAAAAALLASAVAMSVTMCVVLPVESALCDGGALPMANLIFVGISAGVAIAPAWSRYNEAGENTDPPDL